MKRQPMDWLKHHQSTEGLIKAKWIVLLTAICICSFSVMISASGAQAPDQAEETPWLPVEFLIVRSTKSCDDALSFLKQASERLDISINLRGHIYDPRHGLTLPKEICVESGIEYPCYVPRGRWDDGDYLSVEQSSAYSEFTPGYFIVVAASAYPEAAWKMQALLSAARKIYPDAYVKTATVYHGCMH